MHPLTTRVLAAALALATAPAIAGEDIGRISDDIAITTNQTVGDLSTVSGDIHLQAKARTGSLTTVSGDVRLGSPVEAILDAAHLHQADLIVMGSRAQKSESLTDVILGSVSSGVLLRTYCPVLVVP